MGIIRTVLGDIASADLGPTLCHEHLVAHISADQILTVDDVVEDLQIYARAGGRAVVELTNTGMGRSVEGLRQLAAATGLHIVCGTGFYKQSHYPEYLAKTSPDRLVDRFAAEIEQGIDNTGIRAGIIGEIGTSRQEITPDEDKVLRAAARAAQVTGAPLSTHTSLGHLALEQLQILTEEKIRLDRVSIGHLDLIPDPDYHTAVAKQGAFVQYDTFGKQQYQSDAARMACLVEMVKRGYGSQILLSCDISRASYLTANGGWGYQYLLSEVVPGLKQSGLDESTVHQILVENPARFLAFDI